MSFDISFDISFEWKVAVRYFISGGMQSVLTVMGVAVGITVFIFLSSLIGGLQAGLVQKTIGSISQMTVEPKENNPRTLAQLNSDIRPDTLAISKVQKYGAREEKIDNWESLVMRLDAIPELTAVSPTVTGGGFATRGNQIKPITFHGILPDRNNKVIDLRARLVRGRYDVSGQNCVIGIQLAKDLGVGLRDKIRTRSAKNREQTFTVQGIFDAGINDINQRSFYVSLNNAQHLFDLVGYITAVDTKVAEVFQANALADRVAAETGLKTESWMRQNVELLAALQGQSGSSMMIKMFTMLSVAFGIASVLIVSVVQKSKEIGILKSMGARTRSITLIFLLQGLFVGVLGASFGCAAGGGLCALLLSLPFNKVINGLRTFPIDLQPGYIIQAFVVSIGIGICAGVAPARRAARMNPVEVIRYG